jgi:hypothetical protein
MSPLLWLTTAIGVPCLYLAATSSGVIVVVLLGVAILLVLFDLGVYVYLVRRDPRLVQSESFQLEARKLDLVAAKGGAIGNVLGIEFATPRQALPGFNPGDGESGNG